MLLCRRKAFGLVLPEGQFFRSYGERAAMQDVPRHAADPLVRPAGDDDEMHRLQNGGGHAYRPCKDRNVPQQAAICRVVALRLVRAAYLRSQFFREHFQQHAFSGPRWRTQKYHARGFAGDAVAEAGTGQGQECHRERDRASRYKNLYSFFKKLYLSAIVQTAIW
ncbi:hypothetical protein D3C80_880350 [compost metagenome]